MPKFDEALISNGAAINRLMANEDFLVILNRLDSDITEFRDRVLAHRSNQADALSRTQSYYLALNDFREWMKETIEHGAAELKKKQAFEAEKSKAENDA